MKLELLKRRRKESQNLQNEWEDKVNGYRKTRRESDGRETRAEERVGGEGERSHGALKSSHSCHLLLQPLVRSGDNDFMDNGKVKDYTEYAEGNKRKENG